MFKRFHAALAALFVVALLPVQSLADYQVKDANGATVTIKARVQPDGSQAPQFDGVISSASTDRSGTIATGGTAQSLMPQNLNRRGVIYQNQSTGDLWVNCLGTAAPNQSSLKIPAGAIYESNPHHSGTGACSIYGASAGQAFYAREF